MNAVFPLIQSTAGFSAQLFNPCNARWPFHFPLLLQFSSSSSSFGLITSTWSCKWKMLPVSCSIHSHLVLHCLRQGALPVFPRLLRQRGSGPRGHSAPSSHTGSWKDVGDLPGHDSTLCMCTFTLQPVPCQSPGETRCATKQGNALPDPPRSYTPRIPLGRNGGRSRAATDTEFPL